MEVCIEHLFAVQNAPNLLDSSLSICCVLLSCIPSAILANYKLYRQTTMYTHCATLLRASNRRQMPHIFPLQCQHKRTTRRIHSESHRQQQSHTAFFIFGTKTFACIVNGRVVCMHPCIFRIRRDVYKYTVRGALAKCKCAANISLTWRWRGLSL